MTRPFFTLSLFVILLAAAGCGGQARADPLAGPAGGSRGRPGLIPSPARYGYAPAGQHSADRSRGNDEHFIAMP